MWRTWDVLFQKYNKIFNIRTVKEKGYIKRSFLSDVSLWQPLKILIKLKLSVINQFLFNSESFSPSTYMFSMCSSGTQPRVYGHQVCRLRRRKVQMKTGVFF